MKKRDVPLVIATAILALIVLVFLTIVFRFFNHDVTMSGVNKQKENYSSLICSSEAIKYPFFINDNPDSTNLKLNLIFFDNKLKSMAVEYNLYYSSLEDASKSEAKNHATMNISFSEDSLPADAFSATYSITDSQLRLNLFTEVVDSLSDKEMKYFMINSKNTYTIPATIEDFRRTYKNIGFDCIINDN